MLRRATKSRPNMTAARSIKALELSQLAYAVHGLPYSPGLKHMKESPPNRFECFCEERQNKNGAAESSCNGPHRRIEAVLGGLGFK
jgi:hypothetical protein